VLLFGLVPIVGFSPNLADHWYEKWTAVHVCACLIAIFWLIRSPQGLELPCLKKDERFLLYAAFLFYFLNIALHFKDMMWLKFFDHVSFVVILIFFYETFREKNFDWITWISLPALFALVFNLGFAGYQIFLNWNLGAIATKSGVGTFSYANTFSEGIALLWCLVIPLIFSRRRYYLPVLWVAGIGSILLVALIQTRSIIFATVAFLAWYSLKKYWRFVGFLTALILLFLPARHEERFDLFDISLQLVSQNILGVGIGSFGFSMISLAFEKSHMLRYLNQNIISESPHNEFLKFAVENGISFSLLMSGLLLLVWKRAVGAMSKSQAASDYLIIQALTFTLVFQANFQFPFDSPFGFLGIATFMALLLRERPPVVFAGHTQAAACAAFLLSVALVGSTFLYYYLHQKSPRVSKHPKLDGKLCEISSEFFDKCLDLSLYYRLNGDHLSATRPLIDGLRMQPNNFILYRELINVRSQIEGMDQCEDVWTLSHLMGTKLGSQDACFKLSQGSAQKRWDHYLQRISQITKESSNTQ
jgi:hypothetical protein